MTAARKIIQLGAKREFIARICAWLILFCFSLGSLPVFGQQPSQTADLVFCPLQKIWVEKYLPKPTASFEEPLAEICAPNREKQQFLSAFSKKAPLLRFIPNSKTTEKFFFAYLEKGKQALAEIDAPQNAPERGAEKANFERKNAGNNFRINVDKATAQIFSLPQAARPPTVRKATLTERSAISDLEKIARSIQPRAPPAFSL